MPHHLPSSDPRHFAWCVQDERVAIIRDELKPGAPENERNWDVLLTTYEVANIEKTALNKIGWRYLIIDEAHRWVATRVHCLCVLSLWCCGVLLWCRWRLWQLSDCHIGALAPIAQHLKYFTREERRVGLATRTLL